MIVALLKATINRTILNGNEAFDDKVIDFYHFLQTFSPRVAEVASTNLRGPRQGWVRRINNSEV